MASGDTSGSTTVYVNTTISDEYNPTNWECGEAITAEKLNKVETRLDFVGGGTLPIGTNVLDDSGTVIALTKTVHEIEDAIASGCIPVVIMEYTSFFDGASEGNGYSLLPITGTYHDYLSGEIFVYTAIEEISFRASTSDDHPILE